MEEKTFIVTHPRARAPLTLEGKSLKDALKKERLDPELWKEVEPPGEPAPSGNG